MSSGEVALLKDKTPKKPKSKNPLALPTVKKDGGATSTVPSKKAGNPLLTMKKEIGEGTRDSPMAVPSGSSSDVEEAKKKGKSALGLGTVVEGEEEGEPGEGHCDGEGGEEERAGQKRKRYITVVEGGKKRKVVDIVGVHSRIPSRDLLICPTAFVPPRAASCY